jgi:hypothetical protein
MQNEQIRGHILAADIGWMHLFLPVSSFATSL